MKGWLAAIGAALLGFLGFYFERSKRLSEKLKSEQAVSKARDRQVKASAERQKEANEAIHEADNKHFTTDDISSLFNNADRRSRH